MPRPSKCPVTGGYTGQVPSDVLAGSSRQESYCGKQSPWAHRLLALAPCGDRQIVLLCAATAADGGPLATRP